MSAEELAKLAQNPVGNLISVPFQNNTNLNFGPEKGTQNILNIQPVYPIEISKDWNIITRTILPVISQPSLGPGDSRTNGVGDPYVEVDWSRSFGRPRPSKFSGAYPIFQGLTILIGFGVVFPAGTYDASDPTQQARSIGNNIWDFAPTAGFTYTSPPILAEGTEISVRFFWNNYLENPTTHYLTSDLFDFEFALTERIGRFQLGVTGFYLFQDEDDQLFGVPIPPDGRRTKNLQLGPILNFDMPEHNSSVKVKALATVLTENTVRSWAVAFGWIKKF